MKILSKVLTKAQDSYQESKNFHIVHAYNLRLTWFMHGFGQDHITMQGIAWDLSLIYEVLCEVIANLLFHREQLKVHASYLFSCLMELSLAITVSKHELSRCSNFFLPDVQLVSAVSLTANRHRSLKQNGDDFGVMKYLQHGMISCQSKF